MTWANVSFNVAVDGDCACCGGPPAGCFFTFPARAGFPLPMFPVDGTDFPYADENAAADGIAESAGDCLVYYRPGDSAVLARSFAANVTGNVLSLSDITEQAGGNPGNDLHDAIRGYFTNSVGLNVTWNYIWDAGSDSNTGVIRLYDNASSLVEEFNTNGTNSAGSYQFNIPSDGYYWLEFVADVSFNTVSPGGNMSINATANGGPGSEFCAIRAAYTNGNAVDYVLCV